MKGTTAIPVAASPAFASVEPLYAGLQRYVEVFDAAERIVRVVLQSC